MPPDIMTATRVADGAAERKATTGGNGATSPAPPPTTHADDGKRSSPPADNVAEGGGESSSRGASPSSAAGGLHYDDDEAAHTFRQRRLTYTKHHLEGAAGDAADAAAAFGDISDDDEEEGDGEEEARKEDEAEVKAEAEVAGDRKRKASGGAPAEGEAKKVGESAEDGDASAGKKEGGGAPPAKKPRKSSGDEPRRRLEPRVLHASAPPPHRRCRKHRLYQHPHQHDLDHQHDHAPVAPSAAAAGTADADATNANMRATPASVDAEAGSASRDRSDLPLWRKRRLVRHSIDEDESLLPFPRDAVGVYSCHGVEPLYDSDYEHHEDEEGDDDGGGGASTPASNNNAVTAKINQDRGGVAFPYGNSPRTALFAAYDGHGEGGELVSQYALHEVQRRLESHPDFESNVGEAFRSTFVEVDRCLRTVPEIEPLYAGTTACVCLMREATLCVANAGDSRTVLARRMEGPGPEVVAAAARPQDEEEAVAADGGGRTKKRKRLAPFDLSVDQNPDSPGEMERILSAGGFVSPPPEEGLSARVWLDPTFTQIGLAMARSIGDHAVKTVGVIAEPVVTTHELSPLDEFMIIATDGVWEFIDSAEAVDIVQGFLERGEGASRACQGLIEAAAAKWHEYEGDYRDDITALVVRFDGIWDHGGVDNCSAGTAAGKAELALVKEPEVGTVEEKAEQKEIIV